MVFQKKECGLAFGEGFLRGLLIGVDISNSNAGHQERIWGSSQNSLVLVSFLGDLELRAEKVLQIAQVLNSKSRDEQ